MKTSLLRLYIDASLRGYDDLAEVFTRVENVQRGDVFLLCTDVFMIL